jgi:hypothetical protein
MWPNKDIVRFASSFLPPPEAAGRALRDCLDDRLAGVATRLPDYGGKAALLDLFRRSHALGVECAGLEDKRGRRFHSPEFGCGTVSKRPMTKGDRRAADYLLRKRIEGLAVKPDEVAAAVAALAEAMVLADDLAVDVQGPAELLPLADTLADTLEYLALAALGSGAPPGDEACRGLAAGSTMLEKTHRNRSPGMLRALDFGLMLWLQARRLAPARFSGPAALVALVDCGGCGWPGLAHLARFASREDQLADRGEAAGSGGGGGGAAVLEAVVALFSETLRNDARRCFPKEWVDYFEGTRHGAPPVGPRPTSDGGSMEGAVDVAPTIAERASAAAMGVIYTGGGSASSPADEHSEAPVGWPSACALGAPAISGDSKDTNADCRLAHAISAAFPGHTQRYSQAVAALRKVLGHASPRHLQALASREHHARRARKPNQLFGPGTAAWALRAVQPISDAVLNPEPEPVVPATAEMLAPLLAHLTGATSVVEEITHFTRGALVPDGRLDLCKQVVGPKGVGPLMEALSKAPAAESAAASTLESAAVPDTDGVLHFPRGALVPDGRLDLCKQVVGPKGVGPLMESLATRPASHRVTRLLLGNNIVGLAPNHPLTPFRFVLRVDS